MPADTPLSGAALRVVCAAAVVGLVLIALLACFACAPQAKQARSACSARSARYAHFVRHPACCVAAYGAPPTSRENFAADVPPLEATAVSTRAWAPWTGADRR